MDSSGGNLGDGGEVDEDQDESSSSDKPEDGSCALEEFRNEWKRELEKSPRRAIVSSDPIPESIEDKAKSYFESGVKYEKAGRLYEAIQFYRRAVQLVPDIELRAFKQSKVESPKEGEVLEVEDDDVVGCGEEVGEGEEEEAPYTPGTDLLGHLLSLRRGKVASICTPRLPTNMTHMSALPLEVFLYLLRWVVSCDLDMRSLEMCSQVCRGFYICCRDPEIWRIACYRVWGGKRGALSGVYPSWRDMYIHRPRLCFGGCYISKTTYIRHGENSFQDQFYRPWHLVEYFRYLRFFPDGRVLSLTTPEEPPQSVALLRCREPAPRRPPVLIGYYCLVGSLVSVVLRPGPDKARPSATGGHNRANSNSQPASTFHLELEIRSNKKRLHGTLIWRGHSVYTRRSGVESNTPFEIHPARYPPFSFSRVKSYSAETFRPLCK